jgi:plastocyanin
MHTPRNSAIASLSLLMLMMSGGERGAGAPRAAAVHRIVIANLAFGSSPADIHVGDTIEWVNRDIFRHTATASGKSFDLDIPPDASASFVPRRPGTFDYICTYHPGMKGRLVVAP